MRVVQVATTAGQSCGIGNFALNLAVELSQAGVDINTVTAMPELAAGADVVLIHYGSGVITPRDVEAIDRLSAPVVVFAHDPGAAAVADRAVGAIAMAPGMLETIRPLLVFPHPAWTPDHPEDRDALKVRLGLPPAPVIGTSGFLMFHRQFPLVLQWLLPEAARRGWFVYLATSKWFGGSPGLVESLDALRARYPDNFAYTTRFASRESLNARLQACDIIWCWTKERSIASASGSVSDQYASGTHLYVTDKAQHRHVLGLTNVTAAPTTLDEFVAGLVAEADAGIFTRHDPAPISWSHHIPTIIDFLSGLVPGGQPWRERTIEAERMRDHARAQLPIAAQRRAAAAMRVRRRRAAR